ncbi:Uu.00g147080.m01.CDS01 [Anthostomella pinea]|uniref:Uu.00g147080.m01.CDS01 n=1 Tax=Anthostomella pinea TaxID=933095 RepID=A0AAI8VRD8_9PEZI|nr:Uu.00g147080.m01.CDS01 [Anthostomella pinea]
MSVNREPTYPFGAAKRSRMNGRLSKDGNAIPFPDSGNMDRILFDSQVRYDEPSLIYPLTHRDSMWSEGGLAPFALGVSGLYDDTEKFPEIAVSDSSSYGVPTIVPSNASSVTFSPPPSTVSRTSSVCSAAAWSPIQTEFTSDNFNASSWSRGPSPLRNVVKPSPRETVEYVCLAPHCKARFFRGEDLEAHTSTGHSHICLWGNNGPCDSAGFATREELNWHVKSEHLLECPVAVCAESTFGTRELLDCHLRWAHGGEKVAAEQRCRSTNLLEAGPYPSGDLDAASSAERPIEKQTVPAEDSSLKMEMSIGTSKKRCREQVRTVTERKLRRANGTPRVVESPGSSRSRTPRLLESTSFPIVWEHGVLPFLVEFLPKWCGPGHVISVSRGSKPNTRRICIMTRRVVTRARKITIAGHVRDLLPGTYRSTITFVFSTGAVDRLVWARGLGKDMPDEVCSPRNPFAYISPCMGDSIGANFNDGEEATATLGPCITIGGGSYWLASFHPFVSASQGAFPVTVEHPSPADRAQCSNERHDALTGEGLDFRVGNLTATSGYDLNTTRITHDPYWEDSDKEPPLVVTDWILISTGSRQANLLRKFPTTTQRREIPVTSMSSVVPGAVVCSTGRTSGYQRGQVCEVPAYVDGSANGTGKASREWYVEEPELSEDEDEWIRGGIGVEGDSGAAIIDSETNALIGQLWGRSKYFGPGPRHTFFTPISDIFDDIQERCGQQSRPQLPQYRDEADRWPTYPICRQCFDLREYLDSRRSSRESLMSMIGMHDGGAGEHDNYLTSVSELAMPKDQSYLVRHIGPDDATSSFSGVVSPAPIRAFYPTPQADSPGMSELRSPYAQSLSEEDLYEARCPDMSRVALGKRAALPIPLTPPSSQELAKRRRVA